MSIRHGGVVHRPSSSSPKKPVEVEASAGTQAVEKLFGTLNSSTEMRKTTITVTETDKLDDTVAAEVSDEDSVAPIVAGDKVFHNTEVEQSHTPANLQFQVPVDELRLSNNDVMTPQTWAKHPICVIDPFIRIKVCLRRLYSFLLRTSWF